MKSKLREKSKWLVAFALCMSCLMLCASILTAPTLALPSAVRDAYYDYIEDTLKTGECKTGTSHYPPLSNFKTGIASVDFADLDSNGVEEMLLVEIGALSNNQYPVILHLYKYNSSSKAELVKKETLGSFGGANSDDSMTLFLSGGKIGAELRSTKTVNSVTTTNYSLKLFNGSLVSTGSLTAMKSGTAETLNGAAIAEGKTFNESFAEELIKLGFTKSWLTGTDTLWAYTGDNVKAMKQRGCLDTATCKDIFSLLGQTSTETILLTDHIDWQHVKEIDTYTIPSTSIAQLMNLDIQKKTNWVGSGTYTVNNVNYENAFLLGSAENKSGVIASADIALNQKYNLFSGSLVPELSNNDDASLTVKFYADSSSTPFYEAALKTAVHNFSQPVTGYTTLTVVIENSVAKGPAKVVLANAKLSTTGTAVTTTKVTTSGSNQYQRVSGYASLYEVQDASGKSLNPKQFVWGYNSATGKYIFEVAEKNGTYYVQMQQTGVYIAIEGGTALDSFDLSKAIWHGEDKVFGTADDLTASLKENKFCYDMIENGEKVSKILCDLVPNWPDIEFPGYTVPTTTATTTSVTTTTDADATTTTSPLFAETSSSSYFPSTGLALSSGAIFAIIILFLSCCYCGYRFFKREEEETAA